MRYFIAGVTILLAISIFCGVNSAVIIDSLSEIEDLLKEAEEHLLYGDYSSALLLTEQADHLWKDSESYFASVLVHDDLDQIGESIGQTVSGLIAGRGSGSEFISEAILNIESAISGEKLLIRNIL